MLSYSNEQTVGALDPEPNTPNPCLSSMAASTASAAAVVVEMAVVCGGGGGRGGGGGGGGGGGSTSNNNFHAFPLQMITGNNRCLQHHDILRPKLPATTSSGTLLLFFLPRLYYDYCTCCAMHDVAV